MVTPLPPPKTPEDSGGEFDAVLTYLNAVSQKLSPAELLEIADLLHELIRRRRRREPKSWDEFGLDEPSQD